MALLNTTSPATVKGRDANASPPKAVPSSRVSSAGTRFTAAPPRRRPPSPGRREPSSPQRLPPADRESSPPQSVHYPTMYLTAMVWGVPGSAVERGGVHRPGGGRVEHGEVGGRARRHRAAVTRQAAAAGRPGGQALHRLVQPQVAGLDQ